MAVFEFQGVVVATGREVRGVRDAESPKGLRSVLRREGIVLTSAAQAKHAAEKKSRDIQLFAFFSRISVNDVAMLTRQLATLVRAGIPLSESINALADQADKEEVKKVLASVRESVNQGISFATALADHPKVFPPIYINMVAAGEASGTLETVLERLASFMDSQAKLRGKVSAALAYPILMVIIGSILVTVLMIGVVPKVTAIFGSLGRALPWYTTVLIFCSEAFASPISHGILCGLLMGLGAHGVLSTPKVEARRATTAGAKAPKKSTTGPAIALSIGFFVLLLETWMRESALRVWISLIPGLMLGAVLGLTRAWTRTDQGRIRVDAALLSAPIFGSLLQMIAVARFAKTLATLLASGVQLLRAMEIVRAVIGNAELERVLEEATSSIREGESIAEPLKRSKRFPPIVTHMITVGEKSGQLEQMLEAVSESYESAVETKVAALTSLLEPLVIVLMGGAVGFIAFAILMPLIQMNDFNTGP